MFPLSPGAKFVPLSEAWRAKFHPAQVGLWEWTDYFFTFPNADALRVGQRTLEPLAPGLFRVRWENALGLCALQPLNGGEPLDAPIWVEVMSPKFPDAEAHFALNHAILGDLWRLGPRLIWNDSGQTARGAQTSNREPSPLETLSWIQQHGADALALLSHILAAPSRGQRVVRHERAPASVSFVDERAVRELSSDASRWTNARTQPNRNGFAPIRVSQSERIETFDTPENRFALALAKRVERAVPIARDSTWWNVVDEADQARAELLLGVCRAISARFHGLSLPNQAPRRAREAQLNLLRARLCGAGEPSWERAEMLSRVRDIATLWEWWTFWALIERIEHARGETAWVDADFGSERGLIAPARAHFAGATLVFNAPAPSYSTPLRPDFLWLVDEKPVAAFDAKFRLDADGNGLGVDLHKMHAYRDALGVGAAVALHPGTQSTFFDRDRGPLARLPLKAVLEGVAQGVGWWGIRPF